MFNKFTLYFLLFLSLFIIVGPLKAQSENVVATVNGKRITEKEIDESIIGQLLPLQQQISVLRKVALENFIIKVLLEEEAKKRDISLEALRKFLTAGKVEISTDEVEKEYLENAYAFAQMSPDEAKEIIRLGLESQARIRLYREELKKLKEQAQIEVKYQENNVLKVSVNTLGPAIGAKEASINIVEFSDFNCPYCKEAFKINKQILQEYGDKVRLVYKHLPLNPKSFPVARASYCAGEQNRFWEYHDALFITDNLTEENLNKIAEKINLNPLEFKACINSENSRRAVLKDLKEAKRIGLDGTPSFIINGKVFRGAIDLEKFRQVIEDELKVKQKFVGK
jgi:protein-disulfide isomerase